MARLLRLLPDSTRPHEPRSVDPSKIAFVSLAAVANRAKPLQRTTPSWHIEVQCGGGGRVAHGPLANVRSPVGPTGAAQQLLRLARSPPNLRARPSLTQSNRPVRIRMPGGVGGAVPRGIPLSRSAQKRQQHRPRPIRLATIARMRQRSQRRTLLPIRCYWRFAHHAPPPRINAKTESHLPFVGYTRGICLVRPTQDPCHRPPFSSLAASLPVKRMSSDPSASPNIQHASSR